MYVCMWLFLADMIIFILFLKIMVFFELRIMVNFLTMMPT
jgi:hypothetical protein